MANPTTVEGLLSAVQNHGANHRGSLSLPVIPKTTGGAHIDFGPGHTPLPRYNRNREVSAGHYSIYGAFPHPKPVPWLNKLCNEPEGDIGTCCLGFWLPCALYGNTQYRLKQMAQGDDPLDLSEHKHNNGPCWMHQMLCFFFRCEWCVVMLQHSRIRATYNIDGTAGGDCVQSYYCPCCTLMQDEREVVAREQRILRQQNGTSEVTEQPGFEPQMRYSTSNLLEEIPEIFREHTSAGGSYPNSTVGLISGQGSARESRRHSMEGRDGRLGHELADLDPFSLGHSDADTSDMEEHRHSRSRPSSRSSSGKLRFRETSPLGSALNPITVSRSVSVDHGLKKTKKENPLPQRSVTSPTRRKSLAGTNPPLSKSTNYRLKSITIDDRPEFLIGTIKEGSESSTTAPTINSRTAVKSLALDSLRSVSSKNNTYLGHKQKKSSSESYDDLRTDEAYTTFYNDQGKMVRRRISECIRPRASTPETPDIYTLHYANDPDKAGISELKHNLEKEAKAEQTEVQIKNRLLVKLKVPPTAIGPAQSLREGKVMVGDGLVPVATPTIAHALPAGSSWLGNGVAITAPGTAVISTAYNIATEYSTDSDILSLPPGVHDADDLAAYLDQAVKDSGFKQKNRASVDHSVVSNGNFPSRKPTLRLDFNSEDSGSDPASTPSHVSQSFVSLSYKGSKNEADVKVISSAAMPEDKSATGIDAVDRYPSYIATSDGATSMPLDGEPQTPLDLRLEDGRSLDDVIATYNQLTPRHKKSVSDWFKDIGRSNSNKSDTEANVKHGKGNVPPMPMLPSQYKDQGYSLGPLRTFSPLGFKALINREKSRGKGAFSTMGPAQKTMHKNDVTRNISMPAMPMEFVKSPLGDATNNAETIMETQDKLQVLQEDFKLMAEEVSCELRNQSPSPTTAVVGDNLGSEWLSPTPPSTIAISSPAKEEMTAVPQKSGHRSFPLVNSANSTPKSSLSKATATATKFLVSSGTLDIAHKRREADTANANIYDKRTLISTINELSATPVYGKSATILAMEADLPSNLGTPSALPEGFLEHMPGEFPTTPMPETPAPLEEVVIEALSPMKYFPKVQTRTSSLKVETAEDTSQNSGSSGSAQSKKNTEGGHIHENQEVEAANQFDPSSVAAAMNTNSIRAANLDGSKESDPFSHPFFSGTAVIDFALINPRRMSEALRVSDLGSEETIRPEKMDGNPLVEGGGVGVIEENPLHATSTSGGRTFTSNVSPTVEVRTEVLKGDDVTTLQPPPDHPVTAERMDDALAAITTKSRASSIHGALTKPILESDDLRNVCDRMNRGSLSYDSDSAEEIVTVGANGPVTPKARKEKKERKEGGVERSDTVVRRSLILDRGVRSISPGNVRLQNALKDEIGGTPKVIIGDKVDVLDISVDGASPVMPAASPKRVHSPAEVMLRGMLGKVTGKDLSSGKDIDTKGDSIVGEGGIGGIGIGSRGVSGSPKKKNSKKSPQRRRARAEKKRMERVAGGGVSK